MSMHIIIDGYNLIRQSSPLSAFENKDIQLGREALVNLLASYKKIKRHRITVVFDGQNAPALFPLRDRLQGIDVVFSRGETADTVIKRMAAKEKQKALIVTSDRDISNYALLQGAASISSPDFIDRVTQCVFIEFSEEEPQAGEKRVWNGSTKKRGPDRRLARKARHQRTRLKKL